MSYYPFGMSMPGRFANPSEYRYGFNGQEADNEISGSKNSYSAQYWQYDPRLGRRWNVDPIVKFDLSSYCAFGNNPIIFVDPAGDDHYFGANGQYLGSDGVVDENGEEKLRLFNYRVSREAVDETVKSVNGGWEYIRGKSTELIVDDEQIQAGLTELYQKATKEKDMFLESTWEHKGVVVIDAENSKIVFIEIEVPVEERAKHAVPQKITNYPSGGATVETSNGTYPVLFLVHTHQGMENNSSSTLNGSIHNTEEVQSKASDADQEAANDQRRNHVAIDASSYHTAYPQNDGKGKVKTSMSRKEVDAVKKMVMEAVTTIKLE